MAISKYSLYTIVGGLVVVAVVVMMTVKSFIFCQSTKNTLISNSDIHSRKTLETLNRNVSNYIESYSVNEYEKLILNEMDYVDFRAIIVHDYLMGAILGKEAYVTGKIQDTEGNIENYDPENDDMKNLFNECFLPYRSEMTSASGVKLGTVFICNSGYSVNQEWRKNINESLLNTIIISSILIILLFWTIHRIVLKPVSKMVAALSVTDQYGIPVEMNPPHGAMEIIKLSQSISSMIATIKASRQKLEQQHELALAEQKQREIIWSTNVGTWEWYIATGQVSCNTRWGEILGYTLPELSPLTRHKWLELVHPDDIKEINNRLEKHFSGEDTEFKCEVRMLHKDGHWVWVLDHGKVVEADTHGKPIRMVGAYSDITSRKKVEEQLLMMGMYDSLTGLYNRNYFEQEMRRLKDGRSLPLGIIICDLNGLKLINDTFGHVAGDELIKRAATLLKSVFRDGDVVARIGGDEFVVLLPFSDEQAVRQGVGRIRQEIEQSNYTNTLLPVSISIGYSVCTEKPFQIESLFKIADNNMYNDKRIQKEKFIQELFRAIEKKLDTLSDSNERKTCRLMDLVKKMSVILELNENEKRDLELLVKYYDIGNVGVPEDILHKSEALTEKEMTTMQKHAEIGYNLARFFPELYPIADHILMHHERWDGRGYPLGKKENQISLVSGIISIAVAYVAMTTDRPFRDAMSIEAAMGEIERCAGTQFDPALVEVLTNVVEESGEQIAAC